MYPSVASAFWNFSVAKEGYLDFMYADVKNLVTTGVGNLIDSGGSDGYGPALNLPWKHRGTGILASNQEIVDAFRTVKNAGLSQKGGGAYRGLTDLYLSADDIQQLVDAKLASDEYILRQKYPGYDGWPADAQLGILSMAWAAGPSFYFPKFAAAVNQPVPDFFTAADESHMAGLNKDREDANHQLFVNAGNVLSAGFDPSILYYPGEVQARGPSSLGLLTIGGLVSLGYIGWYLFKRA